jgi:large subunit ribosomal protein L31
MRENIHPTWFEDATMTCVSCGTVHVMGSTVKERRLDVCSNCHPFYTGEQRIVDTEGQVDRFYKRLQQRDEMVASRDVEEEAPETDVSIEELELGKRYTQILQEEGITTINDVLTRLEAQGDDALLSIAGIGRKVLSDVKKKLRMRGFELAYELDEA